MTSAVVLAAILIGLSVAVVGLVIYILVIRHCSWKDFLAHRRGRDICNRINEPKARIRLCSCCGKDLKTAKDRPECLRNPNHPNHVKD